MPSSSSENAKSLSMEHVIYSEILAITSVMRRNSRWAARPTRRSLRDDALVNSIGLRRAAQSTSSSQRRSDKQEFDLLGSFDDLKRLVRDAEDISQLSLSTILGPFLSLIRSPLSTGPITSVALTSLSSFLNIGLISPASINLRAALADMSNAVAHCKFEATDVSADEVVTLRILNVIRDCMLGDVGLFLGDFEVCEMLEAVLTTCCQMRLSEILRRSASLAMHAIVRRVFSCLKTLDPSQEEQKLRSVEEKAREGADLNMQVSIQAESTFSSGPSSLADGDSPSEERSDGLAPSSKPAVATPYGLPAVTELLRVLINLLDPGDKQHTDSTRLIALSILNTVFETAGFQIALFSTLKDMVVDRGCKYLFLLARSENPSVLYLSLKVISTMFETMRHYLKLQQELFLAFTLDRLAPPPSSGRNVSVSSKNTPSTPTLAGAPSVASLVNPTGDDAASESSSMPPSRPTALPARGETRELLLQTLTHLCRSPSFMVDLYVNYDCDVNCENLLERLIGFSTKGVYPTSYTDSYEHHQQTAQILCLELLLTFVQHMSRRAEGISEVWPSTNPKAEILLHHKSQKQLILTGAARFNAKPKLGLAFMEENKLIYNDGLSRPLSLAKFLRSCPRLDKKLLGDFLSRPENLEVLEEFMKVLDFKGTPIAEAMRELLEAFRLPGEAQQIARITETFASKYFATEPDVIKTDDAVYVLAYSIILLNTDLHNPQVRKRMTLEDYQRNLRGVNNGSDFPPEYLQSIYNSIRKKEIVMPEEHVGQVGFEYAWKELLIRSQNSGNLIMCNSSLFDVHIFKLVWKPVISALAFAFTYYDDDYIVQRAISGFHQCAMLAKRFDIPEVFDHIVTSVSPATSLLDISTPTSFNFPTAEVEGQVATISGLSVQFGENLKGQLATIVLFTIVSGNARAIRDGWLQIMEIYHTLFSHSLLPPGLLQQEEFLGGATMIPLQGAVTSPQPAARSDVGLLFALSSYLMTPYGSGADALHPQATDKEIECTLCTVDCITACRIDEFYSEIMKLDGDSLLSVLRACKTIADRKADEQLTDADSHASRHVTYDPGPIYLLETMLSVTVHGQSFIEDLWPVIFEHLNDVLSKAVSHSTLLVERAVVGLIRLCNIIADQRSMRDQLYVALDLLGSLPAPILNGVGEQILTGVVNLMHGHQGLVKSPTEWALLLGLLRGTISNPGATKLSFDLLADIINGEQQAVNADNFTPLLGLLQEYALIAGKLSEAQRHPRAASGAPQERVFESGVRAVGLMFDLRNAIPRVFASRSSSQQVWSQFSLPLLIALAHQSSNSCREVRHASLSHLQRLLLGPPVNIMGDSPEPSTEEDIFTRVVFSLVDELLKPDVIQRDPTGMSETRIRVSALLCRVFLQYEIQPEKGVKDIRLRWMQMLDLLERLMKVDKRDPLYESVPESLKNVILVMYASEILVPPGSTDTRSSTQKELWDLTYERLERFLPGFLSDILGAPSTPPVTHSLPLPPGSPLPITPSTSGFKPKSTSML